MTTVCPNCATDLIHRPETSADLRAVRVGLEYPDIYDGVLFWACPQCDWAWPRDFRYQSHLREASRERADRHNEKSRKPRRK